MLPEGSEPGAVTGTVAAAIIRAVNDDKREKGITFRHVARGIGVSEGTLSAVLNGKYAADARPVLLDLDRWLDDQLKIDLAPKPASFVWTSVAREVETIARAAVEPGTIALVYGPETSGLGKTTALQAVASERAGCIFITADKVHACTTGLLELIAAELRIGAGYNNDYIYERIVEGPGRDEPAADRGPGPQPVAGPGATSRSLVLADLYERTNKAPQLWAGTTDVVGYLRRGQAKGQEPLSLIRSRIGTARDLTQRARRGGGGDGQLFTVKEIRGRLRPPTRCGWPPRRPTTCCGLANLPDGGALRTCKNLVVMATALFGKDHPVLTEDLLRQAHRMLVTDESVRARAGRGRGRGTPHAAAGGEGGLEPWTPTSLSGSRPGPRRRSSSWG